MTTNLRNIFGTVVHDVPEGTTPIELRKTFGTVVHDVPEGTTPIELRKTFATAVHDADVPFLVPNISGTVGISASFDASSQSLDPASSTFHWSWNSVPAGSSFGNSSYPLPDNGVNTYFDMTSNDVLYHFEGDADDSSGNSNNGSMTGISFLAGKIGADSAGYDNSSSKIEFSSPVNITGDYTIGFWFYNLKNNGGYRTGVRDGAGEHAILLNISNDNLGAWFSGFRDCGFNMPAASYTGWNHILVIGDSVGGTSTYYVNGSQAGIPINYVASTNISIIGNTQAGGQQFADRIDEFAMWSRKLSVKEVRDLFFLQSGSVASDLSGNVGLGETFTFVPDASGTYESNLNMTDGTSSAPPSLSGSVYAYISSATPPGPGPGPIITASNPQEKLVTAVVGEGYALNTYKILSVQRARKVDQIPFTLGTKGISSLRLRTNQDFSGSA